VPESQDDFERMLIAQPNSSYLWVQYIAFHLQSAAIDAARAVAVRALRTIDFREEDVSTLNTLTQDNLIVLVFFTRTFLLVFFDIILACCCFLFLLLMCMI
jgi:hypothetical protein